MGENGKETGYGQGLHPLQESGGPPVGCYRRSRTARARVHVHPILRRRANRAGQGQVARSLLTFDRFRRILLSMGNRSEVPYGTLDLMVLKTLDAMGPLHGYGIARRIEQVAEGALELNQGTIYPALLRLEQKGWISSEWGASENNRRARFYSITRAGRKQLAAEAENWSRTVAMMTRMLEGES